MTDHDPEVLGVLAVQEELAWQLWHEVSVDCWAVRERAVRGQADLNDVGSLESCERKLAGLLQGRDI